MDDVNVELDLFAPIKAFRPISYKEAARFLLPRHYSGRLPTISHAYGVIEEGVVKAVCTFGEPASPFLCVGIAGKRWQGKVIELNRLCRVEEYSEPLSKFVAWCLNQLKQENLIVVSYSDTAMGHHGYIYQACNFMYTGLTRKRTDKFTQENKHARHYNNAEQGQYRVVRSPKHRYIYLCGDKRFRRAVMKDMRVPVYNSYPKGDNQNYTLGEYLKPVLVEVNQGAAL